MGMKMQACQNFGKAVTVAGMSLALLVGFEAQSASVHFEDMQRYGADAYSIPPSIAQPVLKDGQRITASSWQVHGYYPYWGNQDAEIPWNALSHLIYFSLELNADGSLGDEHQWLTRGQDLVEEGHRHGVKVLACVTMFDDEAIRAFLASANARQTAIELLVDRVTATGADGVNLDFEFVPASNGESPSPKQNFVTFVQELKAALVSVSPSLELSLATPAVDWSGTYDYDALAEASDGLLIMGYGYHWAGGAPGPISPIEAGTTWNSRSLTWTLNDYDTYGLIENRSKFILGLPLYGRQWPTVDDRVPGTERSSGVAVSLSECDESFVANKVWDEDSATPYRVFEASGGWEQLFCEDLESLQAKYTLVRERELGGLMFWDVSKIPGDHPAWNDVRVTFGDDPGVDPTDPSEDADPADPTDATDGSGSSDPSELDNGRSPVVVVTAPEAVEVGQVVRLDASQSYDEDDDTLNFLWASEGGPSVQWLEGPSSAIATTRLAEAGVYRFSVEVSDGQNTASGMVEVVALEAPIGEEDEGGCAQTGGAMWLCLLIGAQFATRRTRTYKGVRATPS